MSDSEELKRLRADLESVNGIRVRYQSDIRLEEIRNDLFDKIAKLEAAADPWRDAREAIPLHIESGGHKVKEVARYARHLEDEGVGQQMKIAGLQDENARLTERVAELDAEIEKYKDAGVTIANEFWVNELSGFIDDMQPPFEGPIEGPELALEPARVLATAAEILKMIRDKAPSLHPVEGLLQRAIFAVEQYSRYGRHEYPMHYKLKGPAK